MRTCDTCKHYENNSLLWRACSCPKFIYGYGHKKTECDPDTVCVEDDEGWGMVPGPKFGCIHHEVTT
jgi:hypothetical protein